MAGSPPGGWCFWWCDWASCRDLLHRLQLTFAHACSPRRCAGADGHPRGLLGAPGHRADDATLPAAGLAGNKPRSAPAPVRTPPPSTASQPRAYTPPPELTRAPSFSGVEEAEACLVPEDTSDASDVETLGLDAAKGMVHGLLRLLSCVAQACYDWAGSAALTIRALDANRTRLAVFASLARPRCWGLASMFERCGQVSNQPRARCFTCTT